MRHRQLLVVEDDPIMCELFHDYLDDTYKLVETCDASEALSLALHNQPDGILLDLMLPGASGFDLCQAFQSLPSTRQIPVFVITSKPAAEYRETCLNLGAAEFLQKPLDCEQLRSLLAARMRTRPLERRGEPRVRLSVILTLKVPDASGKPCDVLTTADDVSASGFLARCAVPIEQGCVVQVFLGCDGRRYAGKARVARTEHAGTPWQRIGFRFLEKPKEWILA